MKKHISKIVLAFLMLKYMSACASLPKEELETVMQQDAAKQAQFEQDRKSLLALVGEYEVRFQFMETAALQENYQITEPYLSKGTEYVFVVEDTGQVIDLQHILVMRTENPLKEDLKNPSHEEQPVRVVKHWRQRWTYEDDVIYEYQGNQLWQPKILSEKERKGTWSQAVFEVDDSPRYEGYGMWSHHNNRSSWQAKAWRPLPRREYTKRNDYDVLEVVNRHTLTPTGWLHEQDNLKLVKRDGQQFYVAQEVGLNIYERTHEHDFSAGREYWNKTKDFWAQVRQEWNRRMNGTDSFFLRKSVNKKALWMHLFEEAAAVEIEDRSPQQNLYVIKQIIDKFQQTHGESI
jgi:hypothetical protein